MVDQVFNRLSKLVFLTTFFIVSISFSGLIYFDNFFSTLGFDYSIFELEFYSFFVKVLISDHNNVIIKTIFSVIFFISFVVIYPRSLRFIYDIIYLCALSIWYFFRIPGGFSYFLLFYFSPFLFPFIFIVLIIHAVFIKVNENKKFNDHIKKVKSDLQRNDNYIKLLARINEVSDDFLKSYITFIIIFLAFFLWLAWAFDIGKQGQKHAEEYLYFPANNLKTVYLVDRSDLKAKFISKVKNGYLFVLEEKDGCKFKKKAIFISDSAILRID